MVQAAPAWRRRRVLGLQAATAARCRHRHLQCFKACQQQAGANSSRCAAMEGAACMLGVGTPGLVEAAPFHKPLQQSGRASSGLTALRCPLAPWRLQHTCNAFPVALLVWPKVSTAAAPTPPSAAAPHMHMVAACPPSGTCFYASTGGASAGAAALLRRHPAAQGGWE